MPGCLVAAIALLSLLVLAPPAAALSDGMPGQATMDGGPGSESMSGGTWADLPSGTTVRPFLKRLTVVNGATSETVYTGGAGGTGPTQIGDVTAVVSPINLCRTGQTGMCYSTPNRITVSLGYVNANGVGQDFADPSVPLRQPVTPDTVFDVVIGLNEIGAPLRWTGANGDLLDWKASGLGTAAGEAHIRLRPSETPAVDWGAHGNIGCSGTPITNCDLDRADDEFLSAGMLLSVDETLTPALRGAVFATQHAIMGYLQPGGTAAEPMLDLQMASSHLKSDGSPQLGTLQAFIPSAGLDSLYGVGPDAATTLFSATRIGDPGTSDAPVFTALSEDDDSSAGLLVTVRNITFSAPTYRLAKRTASGPSTTGPSSPSPSGPSGSTGAPSSGTPLAGPAPVARPIDAAPVSTVVAPAGRGRVTQASRKKGVALVLTGARAGGRATATVLLRGRSVATGSVTVGPSGAGMLRVRFGRAAQRKLRRVRTVEVRLKLPGQATRTLKVKLK